MRLRNQLLRKNPDCDIKTVVLFISDIGKSTQMKTMSYDRALKLCREYDYYGDLIFVSGYIQQSLLGDYVLYCFAETEEYNGVLETS